MSKQTVQWHEACLHNMQITFAKKAVEIQKLNEWNERLLNRIGALRAQIERAKKEGRKDFDEGKFNVPYKTTT